MCQQKNRIAAPIISITAVNIKIYLAKRTNPPIENWFKDSCMMSFCFSEIFFPIKKASMVDMVIIPNPPHCRRIRITDYPKVEKSPPVSSTVNPVTHVAEVAVNKALIKPILFPALEAEGKLRSIVPTAIAERNPNTNTLGGDRFFSFAVLIGSIAPYLVLLFSPKIRNYHNQDGIYFQSTQ